MIFENILPKLFWILQILCALGIIILVHELGHFITAKRSGMKVHEFAIGGGPALFQWERNGTVYSLRPYFPFFGFVRIAGLEGEENAAEVPGSFHQQPLHRRMIVLSAGALMNIVLGAGLFCIIYGVFGVLPEPTGEIIYVAPEAPPGLEVGDQLVAVNGNQEKPLRVLHEALQETPQKHLQLTLRRHGKEHTVTVTPKVREIDCTVTYPDGSERIETQREGDLGVAWYSGITSRIEWVSPKSPADQAGLQAGDQIVAVNGEYTTAAERIQWLIQGLPNQPVQLTILRQGQELTLTVTPRMWQHASPEEQEDGTLVTRRPHWGQIGVEFHAERERLPFGEAILQGSLESIQWILFIPRMLLKMVQKKAPRQISGPVGIVKELYSAASRGLESFLHLVALFSINIAFFNLFPLPALDGGRLLVLILEGIRRKPINPRREAMVHFVGLLALLVFMVVISINDIRLWIQGNGP